MMTKGSRILVLVAALALGLAYVLPVWRISLIAPQYPEGLGMVIRIHTIVGAKEHDLDSINNLNHYIGMKKIVPESIPALAIMPMALGALLVLGAGTAALGRRKILHAFTGVFLAFAVAGMVDFWMWNYDYGHDLDQEHAIIKIPGMSYQPPLIGTKQILNFRASSWPASGGWVLIVAGGVFTLVSLSELLRARRKRGGTWEPSGTDARSATSAAPAEATSGRAYPATPVLVALALGAMLPAASCGDPQPRDIAWGTDACEACRMSLADEGHAAQAVTRTGRAYVFDSIECLAGWLPGFGDPDAIHSLWVTDFAHRPTMIRADHAYFLVSEGLASPMGLGLTAFLSREDRDDAVREYGGQPLDWEGVRALVAERWPDDRPGEGMHAHGAHAETLTPSP